MSDPIKLTRKNHIDDLNAPGMYCFVGDSTCKKKIILACPVCGVVMECPHTVLQEFPLTLAPSVVGPLMVMSQVNFTECGHHFWVRDGFALNAE
jgi:hypothetical protein